MSTGSYRQKTLAMGGSPARVLVAPYCRSLKKRYDATKDIRVLRYPTATFQEKRRVRFKNGMDHMQSHQMRSSLTQMPAIHTSQVRQCVALKYQQNAPSLGLVFKSYGSIRDLKKSSLALTGQ